MTTLIRNSKTPKIFCRAKKVTKIPGSDENLVQRIIWADIVLTMVKKKKTVHRHENAFQLRLICIMHAPFND